MSKAWNGTFTGTAQDDEYNRLDFLIRSITSKNATAGIVKVMAVTNSGGVSAVGFVDILPLVNQIDGDGQGTPHGTIHNIPYLRVQGGTNAIIIDPKVGDIGLAIYCSHDISTVKQTKAQANPGSYRRFDMADGVYLGGILNGVPVNYIQLTSAGEITLKPATTVTIMGDVHCTGTVTGDTDVVGGGKSLKTHKHSGVTVGGGQTGTPV